MKVTMSLSLRTLSVFITVSFLSIIGVGQVKIREKIDIAPKIKISGQVNSNSTTNTTIPLLYYDTFEESVRITRPCHINASGSIDYEWAGGGTSYAVLRLDGENFITYDLCFIWATSITTTPASFDVGRCYQPCVRIFHGGGMRWGTLTGEISGNQAILEWTEGTATVATATITAKPLPEYELSNCIMTAYPTYLDANDDGSHEASIYATFYNGSGNLFTICKWYDLPLSMTFEIENPLNGMTLRGTTSDGTSIEGASIEVSLGSASSNVFFVWDGGDIPNEIDTVSIRAEAYGVSAVQKIQLKKDIHPSVQITSPSQDITVLVTERHQPVVTFEETHTPRNGAFTPIITWAPSKEIDTKDYYYQLQDTMSLTVSVTAKNSVGEATDKRVLLLKKVEDVDHFNVTITPDSILSDEYAQLSAVAIDKYGKETELDDNTVINISASPDENISYWNEAQYSDLKAGNIYLYPGKIPAPIQDFIFTVSGNGASGIGKLVVKRAPCIVMSVSSTKIHPGEKVGITMKQLDCNGNLTSYPPDQVFSLWMNTNEQYGRLRCATTGDEGSYAYGQQPFEFIAASNIDVDSTVVEIDAWTSTGGGIADAIGIGTKDTLRLPGSVMANVQTKAKNIGVVQNEIKRKGLEFTIDRLQTQLNKNIATKGDEKQKQKLAINLEQLKARLAYETAKTPAEKQKSLTSMKQMAMLDAETAECKSTASITITKESCIQAKHATLSIGDTISLSIVYGETGGLVPADKLLDILIPSEGNGTLLVNGGTGTSFTGVTQPIRYIAPANISGDSLIVPIAVSESESSGGGGSAASIRQKDSLKLSPKKNSTMSSSILKVLQAQGTLAVCPIGSVTIDGPELVVISPKDNAKELKQIDRTPKMPDLIIKAQLKNYDKDVTFDIKFTKLQWTAPGTTIVTKGHFDGEKTGSGEVEIPFTLPDGSIRGGDDITIDVRAVAGGKTYTKTLTNPFKIEGLNPNKSDVCAEISTVAPTAVSSYIPSDTKMLQIIAYYLESGFKQFETSPGFPYQGIQDKYDFGIMQINHPSNDDLIWNWKKNIAGGMGKFSEKKNSVGDYITAIKNGKCWPLQPVPQYYYADPKDSVTQIAFNPTPLTDIQKIQEVFQRYNGGVYWRWVPDKIEKPLGPGKWIEDPSKLDKATNTYGGYSIRCMDYYNGQGPCE